jgi:hypothetical protein
VDRADDDHAAEHPDDHATGSGDGRPNRREVLHDLTGVLAAAALRVETARRRQHDPGAVLADLALVEAAVAEARRIVADLQAAEAAVEPGRR